jgi:hypothetical protein
MPIRNTPGRLIRIALVATSLASPPLRAQVPTDGEVRQLVTFRFLPGRASDGISLFRDRAVPLYRDNEAMMSFRGFREVESPIPLDLVVVSSFRGMAGMDASNADLRALAAAGGSSIGAIYGAISAVSERHDDQFVEMLSSLVNGDPSARPLVALVWYQAAPGRAAALERALEDDVVVWERNRGVFSATGRFLVSDGWSHLRFLGFDSLADYQTYWKGVTTMGGHDRVDGLVVRRREVILAPVPELSVR